MLMKLAVYGAGPMPLGTVAVSSEEEAESLIPGTAKVGDARRWVVANAVGDVLCSWVRVSGSLGRPVLEKAYPAWNGSLGLGIRWSWN